MKVKLILIYLGFILRLVLILPLIPYIYWLGKKVKKSIPDLPEAHLNITGTLPGKNPIRNALLVGESSIAGVGITDHAEGIPGEFAKTLKERDGKGLRWHVVAKSGYKAVDVAEHLLPICPSSKFDFTILGLGGNDTFQMTAPWKWRSHMMNVIQQLRLKYPDSCLIVCAMPPIADFAAFPLTLKWFLGGHVNLLRKTIDDIPQKFTNTYYLHEKVKIKNWLAESNSLVPSDFFSDGVHPSKLTYQIIGREVAYKIMNKI